MTQIITKTDVQNFLGVVIDSSIDGYVSSLIGFAQDYIERYCGNNIMEKRLFSVDDVVSVRYYDGNESTRLPIDDLRELTSLSVFGVSLVENQDFILYPLNSTVKEWIELIQPETRLNMNSRIQSGSPYIFNKGQRNIIVSGKFGYSTTAPDLVKTVAMSLVADVLKENISDDDVKVITQESLGDYSASYESISSKADKLSIKSKLDMLKRKPLAEALSGKPKGSAKGTTIQI